jgi:replicative DNA helicase
MGEYMEPQLPPHDLGSEQAVLGAMLINPNAIPVVAEMLTGQDFYRETHGKMFDTMLAMWMQDENSVDTVTIANKFDGEQRDLVHSLAEFCPSAANVKQYAEVVRHASVSRGLIRAGNEIAELGYTEGEESKLLDRAETKLTVLRTVNHKHMYKLGALGNSVIESLRRGDKPKMISSGFRSIDEYISGLYGSTLTIVGARPGIGKTCLGLSVARRVAEHGTVMFFSMEMKASELMERLLASEACVSLTRIRERSLNADELARVEKANGEMAHLDLRFIDDSGMTAMNLCSQVRMASKRDDVKLVVVDYLQLMSMGGRVENRREEVSEMSRKLKALSMELDIPIIALSQLNRVSTFDGAKVDISQLKESGSLEQDADCVWLMDWPKQTEFGQKSVVVKVAKNRHGPLGDVDLVWLPQYQRYEE